VKLKPKKGLNFPDTDTDFAVDALTPKDRHDLDFVASHADAIEYSFVQSADDVIRMPDILAQAASAQPTAVMIARGDLAVELGFNRMAEMQEEMLWLAEAAHVQIWATQVLENLVSKGTPLRGEMTDAAVAARAECVMLNKGPFICEGVDALEALLERMSVHQNKKIAELLALRSWPAA